ncbi:MAG TPA: cytochrome c [Candidatus Acidoferrales bacterium]|nr:cytochrome c [Candidatus Acidoferrales bacterium]
MRNFFLGVLVTLVAVALATCAYIRFGFAEVRGDLPVLGFETSLMRAGIHASIRREAPEMPNPVAPTDANLIKGGKYYLEVCAGCHGTPGKPFGVHGIPLIPLPPEFPLVGTELDEAQVFWVAKHGIRRSGMFANGAFAKDQDLWLAATYIKHMGSVSQAVKDEIDKPGSGQH